MYILDPIVTNICSFGRFYSDVGKKKESCGQILVWGYTVSEIRQILLAVLACLCLIVI